MTEAGESRYEREFLHGHARLASAGFEHYEVSNYARPGKRAIHNSAYWRGVPYIGLGPSAHGFDGAVRRANTDAFAEWARQLDAGEDPIGDTEQLSRENRVAETVYLGLRTIDGLAVEPSDIAHVARWIDAGWVELTQDATGSRLKCTPLGWLRLDALAADLTAFRSGS